MVVSEYCEKRVLPNASVDELALLEHVYKQYFSAYGRKIAPENL